MGDDSEWLKLATDDKVQHKVWKARVAGYEECVKLFQTLNDEKSPEFSKFLGLVKKFVVDSNAVAQEKALDAVLAFVENAHVAGKTTGEVCNGVICKCLNSSRTRTKEKGFEILMMYIEIEKQEIVQDELIKGLSNKQPKVVAGCIVALRMAIRDFGTKTIQLKPIVKQLQRLLEDRDKTVREEAKQLVVEIYRWIGAALKPQLASLKPVQIQELEAEFDKLPPGKPVQQRFLRSQQDLKAKMEEQAAAGEDEEEDGEDEAAAEVDPFDLMEPVDILSKLPKDFYDKIEAKKWQERREALEEVHRLAQNPKLEQGDYADLIRAVKKVVSKDSNVMLVTLAAKCMTALANGLRKKYAPYAVQCIDSIVEKFREKKPAVVAALREAIDAIYQSTNLEAVSEIILAAMEHKTPTVKSETIAFLTRCFTKCTPTLLPKKLLKPFVTLLTKTVNDTTPDVREASFQALGTAMKVVGEKAMTPFISDLDNIKMGKIKECFDNAVVVGKGGKASGGAAKAEPKPPEKKEPPKTVRGRGKPGSAPQSSTSGAGKPPGGAAAGRPKTAPAKAGGKKGQAKGKKGVVEETSENILADEVVEEKATDLLTAQVLTGLASSNWKERLAAMEKFTEIVKGMSKETIPCQVFVRTVTKKPGLKETNFQVLKLRVELLALLAKNSVFSKRSADFCLPELVDKVGDVKNGAAVQETLSCIAEACSLEYVSLHVIQAAFDQKNPKNQAEALNWLSAAIKEFGLKVNIKPMLQYIKKAFGATNPAVRTAAISMVGVAYMYMGATLRVFFEDEKPALLQQIDAEIDKIKGEKAPTPTRGLSSQDQGEMEDAEEDEEAAENGGDAINVADLVPRNDISEQIKAEIITEMGDKNWKVRGEALQKVISILNEAKFITPNIGPLPEAIKSRLGDSNKNLVSTTLGICTTLAQAMGPNIKQHVRIVGPGIVACLGDSKPHLRATAVGCLNTWVEQSGLIPFVEAEIFSEELRKENPNLRAELLGWLADKLGNYKKLPQDEMKMCINPIFVALEDRNGEVRKKAQEVLVPFMIHVGYESMARAAGKLKPSSKDQVVTLLEKAKGNLPAKPVKKAAPKAAKAEVTSPTEEPEPVAATSGATKAAKPARPKSGVFGAKKAPAASTRKKVQEEEDLSPPMKVSNGKDQRFKEEKTLKILKWNFTQPRLEFVDQLKTHMEPTFSKTFMEQLFHNDFKQHIKAIEVLLKCSETMQEETMANMDIILKWLTLRFFDTNTSVLLKGLEYLQSVFNMLSEHDYHMQELEASAFIPYLVNKVGDPKDSVRRDIRNIFKLICKVYPASKMFSYIIDGLKSKNSKQRTECLEELGSLIETYGINVCQPSPAQALKSIAGQISDRDNSVRSTSLNTIVVAYSILGDTVYKYIGNLKDKDQGMLDERIKRSAKNKPPPPAKSSSPEERPKTARIPEQTKLGLNRPNTAPERHPTVTPRGKAKGEFQLQVEEDGPSHYEMPKLIEHDLDDLLAPPIELPKTRVRPPSPSIKLLTGSSDAKSAIDLVTSQVASNDIITSIQALAQIDEVLKDEEKAELMSAHVDQFLVACSLQLRMAYSKHMGDEETAKEHVLKLYKCLMASLLSMFHTQCLAKEATRDVLKDLIFNLVTILLDSRLMELDEGPQIVRTVNVVVVKMVERAESTNVMSALIKLLHESISNETCSPKFLELIMKCLWKMVRMLPNIINDLNVDRILADMHHFLKAFPSNTWKSRSSDVPLRTVKTILHSLAKLKGNKITSHMTLIDNPQESEMEAYLQKVLKNGLDANAIANNKNEEMNGTENGVEMRTPRKDASKAAKRLSKTTHDMLAEIFKKIGSKENTREGLNDLYDFKLKYPEADLDPFLKKSSQFFQDYIGRGLKNIELEREGKLKSGTSALSSSSSGGSLNSLNVGQDGDINTQMYMERLKVLRARCGLDNSKYDGQGNPRTLDPFKSDPSQSEQMLPGAGPNGDTPPMDEQATSSVETAASATANLQDLMRRLERIKGGAKK